MSEIKFNDYIKTVEETLAKIEGIRKEAEEKLVPEIRHELDMTLADLVKSLNSFKTDIAAIGRIYAVREDIQSTILFPVTQKINEATAHSVFEIKNESLSGVRATRKWTIISIVVAFLFAMFLNRGLDSLILFLKKCCNCSRG